MVSGSSHMGMGVKKDIVNAVNKYGNEDFYLYSAAISSAVVIFSCWFLAAIVILIVIMRLFFKLIHSPAAPGSKKNYTMHCNKSAASCCQ